MLNLQDQVFEITETGLTNGLRNAKDGVVFFGSPDVQSPDVALMIKLKGLPANDFAPRGDSGLGGKHFKVFYLAQDGEFYIQDLGEGSGTFVKVIRKTVGRWDIV
jgi:hypothetical protein